MIDFAGSVIIPSKYKFSITQSKSQPIALESNDVILGNLRFVKLHPVNVFLYILVRFGSVKSVKEVQLLKAISKLISARFGKLTTLNDVQSAKTYEPSNAATLLKLTVSNKLQYLKTLDGKDVTFGKLSSVIDVKPIQP